MENGVGESFKLEFVGVGIFSKRAAILAVLGRETFHHAGLVIPREKDLSLHAAVFALNVKAFLEIAAAWDGEVEMSERATGKLHFDVPAEGAGLLAQSRADTGDVAAEPARGVHEMARVREEEVAPPVGLGISFGPARGSAGLHQRLEIVRHRVAMDRVPIPRLDREERADLLRDELSCKGNAGIKAPVVPDLEDTPGLMNQASQLFTLLDGDAQRFLDEHMLAGGNGLLRERDVKLIRHAEEQGLDAIIRQHLVEVAVGGARLVQQRHALAQVIGEVTDGRQLDVARLAGCVEVRDLRDGSAAEDSEAQEPGIFFHGAASCFGAKAGGNAETPPPAVVAKPLASPHIRPATLAHVHRHRRRDRQHHRHQGG